MADEAAPSIGQMKFRQFAAATAGPVSGPREAQVMVRHPNNSGLQRDQVTLLYIPAHFVDELSVWQGDALLFSMVGGISISEDPNFRFNFVPNGAAFRVEAKDTEGKVFRQEWPATEM
jgi:sulfur-oxidizing protein SoxY